MFSPHRTFAAFALAALLGSASSAQSPRATPPASLPVESDAANEVPSAYDPGRPPYRDLTRQSLYVRMRDGVPIALDLYLPRGLAPDARIPAILQQTRYWRSPSVRFASLLGDDPPDLVPDFVRRGYAWIVVDARGSGASFGSRPAEWSEDEVKDGAEILDWIAAQPWSNGKVGALGTSYDGTAAEMLVTNGHPALLAAAPRFSLVDAYADIAFPGGIRFAWFTERWGRLNDALDRNTVPDHLREMLGFRAGLLRGVRPVDEDRGRTMLADAVRDHEENYDVHAFAETLTFRDDPAPSGRTIDPISPATFAREIQDSGAAIYSYSGWYDGAYARAAVKRHRTLRNPKNHLILGPWDHGGRNQVRNGRAAPARFDHTAELLKFFDRHLKGIDTGIDLDAPVHYYTQVEGRWKETFAWPPPASETVLHLARGGALAAEPPQEDEGEDAYTVDPGHGTGASSRWNSLLGLPVSYADRALADRTLLVYQGPPLAEDLEVTGHPILRLFVASDAEDGAFFAYLEDVDPAGRVTYVTEGQLRALHRKLAAGPSPQGEAWPWHSYRREDARPLVAGEVAELVFDLLPTSYLFRAGHSVRLALAGADADHFAQVPATPPTWAVQRNRRHPSQLVLPVVKRRIPVEPPPEALEPEPESQEPEGPAPAP